MQRVIVVPCDSTWPGAFIKKSEARSLGWLATRDHRVA